jgi:predicted GIY-YIG superfamily endonuclease
MGKRRRRRDTYLYHLKQGRKTKYTGITNDPDRRKREHQSSGKRFTHMFVHPYPMSRKTALKREKKKIL